MTALPARPPISAPAPERGASVGLGLRGLWLVVPIAILLAAGAGGPETSLLVLGPLVTFSLPLIAMVAFWWEDWPGTRLRASWSGWADTVLIACGAVVLTAVAQILAGGLDVGALFTPGGRVPTFPATLPLGAAVFVVMLQITLVGEGWPLRALPARVAGPLALAASWAIALGLYFALVEIAPPLGTAVTARSGPVAGADFGAALVWIGAWQVLCFVVWRGWPTSRVHRRGWRLVCAHTLTLGGGLATFAVLRQGFEPVAVTAAGGCFVAGGLLVGMLFELAADPPLALVAALLVSAGLFALLAALAAAFSFGRATADDWIAHASLNALAVSTLLYVGVGRRRPFSAR
jgi:hypothetical protein